MDDHDGEHGCEDCVMCPAYVPPIGSRLHGQWAGSNEDPVRWCALCGTWEDEADWITHSGHASCSRPMTFGTQMRSRLNPSGAPAPVPSSDTPSDERANAAEDATWSCKIGPASRGDLPSGSDAPMRRAVEAAFRKLTGHDPEWTFSEWAHDLTEAEQAMIKHRLPRPQVIAAAARKQMERAEAVIGTDLDPEPAPPPTPVDGDSGEALRFTAEVQGERMIYVLVTDHGDSGETYSAGPFTDEDHAAPRPDVAAALAAQINRSSPPVGEERRPVDGGERSQSEQWFVVHHNQLRSLRFGTFPIERLARASIAACTCGPHTLRHTVTTTYTASTTEEFVAAAADRGEGAE